MKTLVTLNLNDLTPTEQSKRDEFCQALKDANWQKVRGITLDTVWTIGWNAGGTKAGADTAIRSHVDVACRKASIPKAKVKVMWAHDDSIKSL